MTKTLALTLAFAFLLSAAGLQLDDHSAEWAQSADLQEAINKAVEQQRFERAAQAICGPQSAWQQEPDGAVTCSTRFGKPTITVRVSP